MLDEVLGTPASKFKYLEDTRRFYGYLIDAGRSVYNLLDRMATAFSIVDRGVDALLDSRAESCCSRRQRRSSYSTSSRLSSRLRRPADRVREHHHIIPRNVLAEALVLPLRGRRLRIYALFLEMLMLGNHAPSDAGDEVPFGVRNHDNRRNVDLFGMLFGRLYHLRCLFKRDSCYRSVCSSILSSPVV